MRLVKICKIACLLFNGPVQGASRFALRQKRACVRGGWRAYLHCTCMPSSTPDCQMGVVSQSARSVLQRGFLYALLAGLVP
jgi:hypothetical protein